MGLLQKKKDKKEKRKSRIQTTSLRKSVGLMAESWLPCIGNTSRLAT
jgi:hypothetical protein